MSRPTPTCIVNSGPCKVLPFSALTGSTPRRVLLLRPIIALRAQTESTAPSVKYLASPSSTLLKPPTLKLPITPLHQTGINSKKKSLRFHLRKKKMEFFHVLSNPSTSLLDLEECAFGFDRFWLAALLQHSSTVLFFKPLLGCPLTPAEAAARHPPPSLNFDSDSDVRFLIGACN